MKFTLALYFYTFCAIFANARQPDQVIEFFRHGARGPLFNYDPQWSKSELRMLTVTGMIEHYELGKKIAEKYPHLVASGYNPHDVYVLANYAQRTIESGMVHVSSVFRGTSSTVKESLPAGKQAGLIAKYESSLPAGESERGNYVPVHVNVVTGGSEEELIFNEVVPNICPVLTKFVQEADASTEMKEAWTIFQDPAQEANNYLSGSQKITNMDGLANAFDAFIVDMYDKRKLPGGINDTDLVESLNYGQAYFQFIQRQSKAIQRELISFNVLKAIRDHLTNFRQGNNAKKLVFLSGHDSNIYAMLSALDVITADCLLANYDDHQNGRPLTDPLCQYPRFASNLIFEFYNDTTSPEIKVYYNDMLVPLCGGKDICSYDDFMAVVKDSNGEIDSLKTWKAKCHMDNSESGQKVLVESSIEAAEESSTFLSVGIETWVFIAAACSSGILFIIGVCLLMKRKKSLPKLYSNMDGPEKEANQALEA